MINPRLRALPDYPFARLNALIDGVSPGAAEPLNLSVGEPQHPTPAMVAEILTARAEDWRRYPPAAGTPEWRQAVAGWLGRRYGLPEGMIDAGRMLLPVSGTREALYMVGDLVLDPESGKDTVLMPDPFYQPYLGATLMNGARAEAVPAREDNGFVPAFWELPEETLARTAMAFVCSPANPQGTLVSADQWKQLISLARDHGFVLIADECYSELWYDSPPAGVLEACRDLGGGLENVLVFNSLSKRSNAAGMRSGFVCGDADLMAGFLRLRSYANAGMPLPLLAASAVLWNDEAHVEANRALYKAKFDLAEKVLGEDPGFFRPPAGFFLWHDVSAWGETGEQAALRLWRDHGVKVLPGAYMTRYPDDPETPGRHRIRVALVHEIGMVARALHLLAAASATV